MYRCRVRNSYAIDRKFPGAAFRIWIPLEYLRPRIVLRIALRYSSSVTEPRPAGSCAVKRAIHILTAVAADLGVTHVILQCSCSNGRERKSARAPPETLFSSGSHIGNILCCEALQILMTATTLTGHASLNLRINDYFAESSSVEMSG